jgi:hypothetical protein
MKYFKDFYIDFIQYIKNLEGNKKFNNCIFNFFDTQLNTFENKFNSYEFNRIKQEEAEVIFNKLLEYGCSWINMIGTIIKNKTLYIDIENSKNFDCFFVGKTDVKFMTVLFGNINHLKYYWNLSIIERFKYRKQLYKY